MGKKIKRPPRSGHKDKRGSTPAEENISAKTEIVEDNVVRKERKGCPHLDKGIDLAIVNSKILFSENIRCEDCRECVSGKQGNKGKGKQAKNKSESKAIWVCLECGHFSCGGIGLPTIPKSHAVRHANQTRHHLAIQYENRRLRWCFPCNKLISVEIGESCELNDPLSDIVKLVKDKSTEKFPVNVEDVWFGNGSILSEINLDNTSFCLDGISGYMVRGLSNLGNTCFFNSIMQNLLALDRLRDHYLELDESVGPLTVSLKQIIVETIFGSGLRNVDNLRSLFDCVCAKAPQFKGYRQHDSHELLRCLLDGLSTEELSAKKWFHQSPSFIDGVFGGQLSSTISCLECGHSSRVFEPFLDLSLPVPVKKTPSKKVNQPISLAIKPKLPPERNRQYLPIVNSAACFPVEFIEPVAREAGEVVNSSMGQNMEPETKTSCSPNQIATEEIDKKLFLGNAMDNRILFDNLDPYIVSKDNDTTSKCGDIVAFHDAGEKNHNQLYDSAQDGAESSSQVLNCTVTTTGSSENLSWLDYVEPSQVVDGHDMSLEFDDCLVNLDIGDEINESLSTCAESNCSPVYSFENEQSLQVQSSEVILLPHKEDCCSNSEILAKEGEFSPSADGAKSPGYFFEEQPLQVQSSEVILLPYNRCSDSEILTKAGEVSTADGLEPDFFEFDGFGDLFNEPEVVGNVEPMSDIYNFQADTSSVFENTESDPDEVDNSNFQVSIESCLASFTKSELLSTPEHGWICENCSNALQEQKRLSKEKQKKDVDKIGRNEVEDRVNNHSSCPSVVQNTSNGVITMIDCLKADDATSGKIDQIFESSDFQENDVGLSHQSEDDVSDVSSNVCGANGSFKFEGQNDELNLSSQGSESETNGDEEMNFGSIKVKRDATKRIFIDKAPSILTIHLKRFSQDACGRLSKLSGHVEFKDAIDLRPYMDPWCKYTEECKYRLSGVVEHSGTMRIGHYVAYIRGSKKSSGGDNNVWYHASDARVRQVSFQQVLQCEAYILFYEKI